MADLAVQYGFQTRGWCYLPLLGNRVMFRRRVDIWLLLCGCQLTLETSILGTPIHSFKNTSHHRAVRRVESKGQPSEVGDSIANHNCCAYGLWAWSKIWSNRDLAFRAGAYPYPQSQITSARGRHFWNVCKRLAICIEINRHSRNALYQIVSSQINIGL